MRKIKTYIFSTILNVLNKSLKDRSQKFFKLEPKYIEEEGKPSTLNNDYFLKDDPRNKTNIIKKNQIYKKANVRQI